MSVAGTPGPIVALGARAAWISAGLSRAHGSLGRGLALAAPALASATRANRGRTARFRNRRDWFIAPPFARVTAPAWPRDQTEGDDYVPRPRTSFRVGLPSRDGSFPSLR